MTLREDFIKIKCDKCLSVKDCEEKKIIEDKDSDLSCYHKYLEKIIAAQRESLENFILGEKEKD